MTQKEIQEALFQGTKLDSLSRRLNYGAKYMRGQNLFRVLHIKYIG